MFCLLVLTTWVASNWALPSPIHPLGLKAPRIINGKEASLGQFPWQVSVLVEAGRFKWSCGGSIISEEWILTAGHCVDDGQVGLVITGSLSPTKGHVTNIAEFILHEDYDIFTLKNDIGLVRLSSNLTFDDTTSPINLAAATEVLESDVHVTVSGWGYTSDSTSSISQTLNYVNLVTINNTECYRQYGRYILDGMVCAVSDSSEVKSICTGDSGGPLVINADLNPVHVGIVSFGSPAGCEIGAPSGFTRTATFRHWIQKHSGV